MRNTDRNRKPYCTGCGVTFDKHHQLINHRRTHRCGGRFLPIPERIMVNNLRVLREAQENRAREVIKMIKDIREKGLERFVP